MAARPHSRRGDRLRRRDCRRCSDCGHCCGRRRRDARRCGCRRRAVTLAEVVVSSLLVGVLMTAALVSVGQAARSFSTAADLADGHALARQLLDEITALPYEDANQPPLFGRETGEGTANTGRTSFDDLDDYIDFNDTPPTDRAGAALPGFAGWSRAADVQKVDDQTRQPMSDGNSDKGLRLVTVTATSPAGRTTTLQAYRSRGGGALQPQGVDQTLVTWVGVSLQAGGAAAVSSGVSLLNHAADQ